jgi:predicted RNA-binding protein YlxR (DUF448 family)
MKARKAPIRTCIACGASSDKRGFVRVVRTPEGDVVVDPSGKSNGRGAYVCADLECFEAAVRKRRFSSALRVNMNEDDTDRLREAFERLLVG